MSKQILPCDFDEAVKQPWSTSTCIVAQAARRITGKSLHYQGNLSVAPLDYTDGGTLKGFNGLEAQTVFDKHFRDLGDEKKPELQALRASLPIAITE